MPFFASPEITDSDEERKWRQKQKEPDQSRRQKRRGLQVGSYNKQEGKIPAHVKKQRGKGSGVGETSS